MKHKILTLLFAIIASVGTMFAQSGTCGDNLTWNLTDGVLTISGTGAMADYQNATQTPWNGYSSLIQSVIMNDNVTTVSNYAFAFCSNLKNVSLNQTLTTIGEHAFFSCPLLESVVIPDNVIVIGYNAFTQCSWLTSVHIGNKVTTIGKGAFARCGRLSSVVMFNSVTSIGENAFYGCSGLTSVTIPNSVTSIGDGAFNGCSNLTTITNFATTPQPLDPDGISVFGGVPLACTLYVPAESVEAYQAADVWKEFGNILAIEDTPEPCITASGACGAEGDNLTWTLTCDSVLTISGMGAIKKFNSTSRAPWYEYRESIKFAVIEEGVTSIGNLSFRDCSVLKSVTIPNSVISIGYDAFGYCSNLTSVIIPNSITSIGSYAFSRSGLTSVTLSNNLTTIETDVFMDCSNLTSVIIPNSITSIRGSAFQGCSGMTSVTFGNGITSIGDLAFCDCNALTNITIPNSVTSIGVAPFSGCDNLTSINVTYDNTNYCSIDGVLFSKDKTALIQYPCGKQGTYTIPNSVISIGEMAFAYCPTLSSITIPSNVTSIDQWAFDSNSLNSITNYATNPQAIHTNVFSHVDKSACTLYVPAESVDAYKAAEVWKDFGNIQPIDSTEEVNYATLADIYNMAADSTFTLGAFDVMYVPDFQSGSNMYIKDSTGSCVIYKVNYGLQAGDHVEAGLQGKVSIYNGLHEVIPITAKEELTITHGEAPAPMVATEVPSLNNASQYVVYEGVSFTTDTAFVEGRRHTVYGSWNGQTITFYNQYYIGATLSANKTYNITAVNTIYRTTPQAYPLAVEEVSPALCIIASGTCGAQGDNLTWTLTCDSVLTISGTGAMADYVASNSISPAPWYTYRTSINLVIIENGVTSIGNNAFYLCSDLTSIDIPNSVTSIGENAFYGCSGLTSVTIPNSVASIGDGAFNGCSNLTTITNFATTPQPLDPDGISVFGGVPLTCTLYVPAQSIALYQAADVWKEFGNILPIDGGDTPSPEERTGQSTEGKDFWVTFLQADQDPNNDLMLSLLISSREDCQVEISNPYTGYMENIYVSADQPQKVELYSGNVLRDNARSTMAQTGKVCYSVNSEVADTCALHIMATSDISLFATSYKRATFDATNVLPTGLLGAEYIVQTYTPSDHGGVSQSQGSHFAIIATEDNTIVDYCPTVMTPAINNAIAMYEFTGGVGMSPEELALANWQVGDTLHTPVLMAGQVFYVWTGKKDGETGDLSGTYVKARNGKRIAVFQGNPHTNIPYQVKQRDQLYSQAMPVQSWGSTFALTASAERPSDIIRVMALYDGTEVRINGETVHTFDFTVDTKHFWEFEIGPSGTYAQDGSCMLTTSQPVAVHLFLTSQRYKGSSSSNGDPAMLWVSPIEQQMEQVNFVTNDSRNGTISNYLNVVTDRPNSMTLDNVSIASYFSPVSGSNTYHYAQIALGSTATAHTLKCNGGRFNAHVYGFTSNESYGYSVGGFIEDLTPHIYINGEQITSYTDNDLCVVDTLFMDITTSFDYQSMKLDFGDGTVVYTTDEEGIQARHAYDAPGVYHANVVVASNNNRLDSISIRIFAGPLSLTCEPLNDIYVGDSIFYIYYHSPIQEMQIEEDFTIDRSFNDAALQDGFGHYTTRLNRSFFGIRIPEGARAGVEYAFNVEIHTLCWDTTATIPFVLKARRTGSCGDNLALTWTYDPGTKTLTITGNGTLNSNYTFGPEAPVEMEQLIIAEGVTSIGANAFSNMSTLQTMQLPASLKTIGASAFENDINLTAIYNYRERPCLVDVTAFNGVNKFDCTLYVLEGSVDMYKSSISDWKDFYFILPIGTTEVTEPVSDVTVEPQDNAATVTWPTSNNAATYTIQITKDGVLFCTLIFNANGQLTGIAFAPSRDGSHHAPAALMTANGMQFTVTGLNSNTQYGYNLTVKDANDQTVATYSGEFTTTGEGTATGVENVQGNNVQCTKVVRDGQIFILRGEKVYNAQGALVK